jgi:hypothetical protein
MLVPDLSPSSRRDYENLPPVLRELLDAELAAGNAIAAVEHGFPAAPIGAAFRLTGPVRSRSRASAGELRFYERNSPQYSGEFTVEPRHFFILEPPLPEPPPIPAPVPAPAASAPVRSILLEQFAASMVIDYEKWHDGAGYDLHLLPQMTAAERETLEAELMQKLRRNGDWRDLEALAALDTPASRAAVEAARVHPGREIRAHAVQWASAAGELEPEALESDVIRVVEQAASMSTLSYAISLAASCRTPAVRRAVLDRARTGDSTTRVHMAALLYHLCGKSDEPFDWNQRPYFLRFGDHNADSDFRAAWKELRATWEAFERAQSQT